jgi:hypothetical protein
LKDVEGFFKFTREELEEIARCVREHGFTPDGKVDYIDAETVQHFSVSFVLDCVLTEIARNDIVVAKSLQKLFA